MTAAINPTSLAAAMAPLYGAAIDMVTQLQLRYATSLYSYATAALALKVQAERFARENFQFSSRRHNEEDGDDASVVSDASVADDAAFEYVMDNGSSRVWSTPHCRPTQHAAVETILFGEECEGKLLVVDRTGSGKSHILRMIGTFTGGIVLVIVPLLALSADQMAKIKEALESHGSVSAILLDECSRSDLEDDVVPRMEEIDYNSHSTLYLFTSPQKLSNSQVIRNALMKAKTEQTLRLVAIDEAHLYAQHGSTFRGQLRTLGTIFFREEILCDWVLLPAACHRYSQF